MNDNDDEFDAGFAAAGGESEAPPADLAPGAELEEAPGSSQDEDTTNGSDKPADTAVAAPAPAPAPAAPAAPASAPAPSAPAPAPAPADDEDPAKLKQRVSTLQGMLRREADEKSELKRQLDEAKKAPPAPPAPSAAPAQPDADALSDEDKALLQELEESAPHLVKGMQAYLKRERAAIVKSVEEKFGKPIQELTSRVQPLEQTHDEGLVKSHFDTITAAHPDWAEVVISPELNAWVQQQPSYLQREFARIAQEGTATEIVEVLDNFRKAHPKAAPAPAPAAAAPAAPATAPAPAAAPAADPNAALQAKRAAQMRALGTTTGRPAPVNPSGTPNKDDFDAGFDLAASQT